ncbi:MAG: hypothetical protein J6M39_00615 [Lachnospiraceae bacterium]|nr:hypothetical protein [Lachnospiraceae bacterium]
MRKNIIQFEMLKKCIIVKCLLICILISTFLYKVSFADSNWSEWQDEVVEATDSIKVETRQVPSSYKMIVYVCTDNNSPSLRSYYNQRNGTLRAKWEEQWSVEQFESAQKISNGTYWNYANNVAGYIRSGDAYTLDYMPYYIDKIEYKTQYRYKEVTTYNETVNNVIKNDVIEESTIVYYFDEETETTESKKKQQKKKKQKETTTQNQIDDNYTKSVSDSGNYIVIEEVINGEDVITKIPNMNIVPQETTSAIQSKQGQTIYPGIGGVTVESTLDVHSLSEMANTLGKTDNEPWLYWRFNKFIDNPEYRHGVTWSENQTPKEHPLGAVAWGCCAYCYDFVYKCYDAKVKPSFASNEYIGNQNEIRAGDTIHLNAGGGNPEHWFAVLFRDGNRLYTAEGNAKIDGLNDKRVRVGWNYTVGSIPRFDTTYSRHQINLNELSLLERIIPDDDNDSKIYDITKILDGRNVAILSKETGSFVSNELGTVHADGEEGIGFFNCKYTSDGWVTFQNPANLFYLSVKDQGYVRLEGMNVSNGEKFKVYRKGRDLFLLNQKENKFVQVINDGIQVTKPLQAARNISDGLDGAYWERFDIRFVDGK